MSRLPGRNDARPHPSAEIGGYLDQLRTCLAEVPARQIAAIADRLWDVARSGGQIFIAGNGGSAATASHMALDLGKGTLGRPPRSRGLRIRSVALNDPGPMVTAWANDHGYERVFAEQIATHARPGDAVVLFSVSGSSPNVVAAAKTARAMGAVVVALLGQRGGAMRALADLAIIVPSDDYGIVEDVHLAINHAVARYLTNAIVSNRMATLDGRRGRSPSARTAAPSRTAPRRRR